MASLLGFGWANIQPCKYGQNCYNNDKAHKSMYSHQQGNNERQIYLIETKCRVPGCFEGHKTHKCRVCNDSNSNHFTRDCNVGWKTPTSILLNQSEVYRQESCCVPGCTEKHKTHKCRSCDNPNSNHFTRDCNEGWGTPVQTIRCKANNCREKHKTHFCKNCGELDSNHCSRDCPLR